MLERAYLGLLVGAGEGSHWIQLAPVEHLWPDGDHHCSLGALVLDASGILASEPEAIRARMTQIWVEAFNWPAMCAAIQVVLSLHASGRILVLTWTLMMMRSCEASQ